MNTVFKKNMEIIEHALSSVNMEQFNKLLGEMKTALQSGGKIITSGLGKNVPVCDKFTGTMLSLGLNANFLHTNSAVHGDMGMVKPGDLVILLTKSGKTKESVYLADLLMHREGVNLWLLSYEKNSTLCDMLGKEKCLIAELEHEGDLWNIIPNNSTTLNLIILQTLAIELSKEMGLDLERDYKPNHPGGAIGAKLRHEI